MRNVLLFMAAAGLAVTPAQAHDRSNQTGVRAGAFVGAQLRLPVGEKRASKARLTLGVAPTRGHVGNDGMLRTRIGEGTGLSFTADSRPALTLAGSTLQPRGQGSTDTKPKLGVSTGGWIAIGAGVAAIAGGLYFVHLVREADENSD